MVKCWLVILNNKIRVCKQANKTQNMRNIYIALILFFFVSLHLIDLKSFPLFEDEAMFLLLAGEIVKDPINNFFIFSENGLMPMFGWLVALATSLTKDSFVAGRLVNILLGCSLIIWVAKFAKLYHLPNTFFYLAAILLLFSPVLLLNSGIALLDTSVLVFTAWYLYFTIKSLQNPVKSNFIGLFISLLLAVFTKATAFFGFPVAGTLLLIAYKTGRVDRVNIFKVAGIYVTTVFIMGITLWPYSPFILDDSGSSSMTNLQPSEIIGKIYNNIWLTLHWTWVYYGHFILLLIPLVLYSKRLKFKKVYFIALIWLLASVLPMVIFNRFYFPRHTLLFLTPLVIIIAGVLSELPRKIGLIFFLIILIFRIELSLEITKTTNQTQLALEDKFAYFENYTSGSTISVIASFLEDLSVSQPIVVYLDGSYVMEYGLRQRLGNNGNITLRSFRLGNKFLPHAPIKILKTDDRPIFVLVNKWIPKNIDELKLVKSFDVSFRHSQILYTLP